jgi:hypothetical protein
MKKYVLFFFVLKFVLIIQFALIIANKQTTDSRVYLITEIAFKTALFVFIEYFLLFKVKGEIEVEDKIIVSFSGGLLLFDAWFNDFPKLVKVIREKGFFPYPVDSRLRV